MEKKIFSKKTFKKSTLLFIFLFIYFNSSAQIDKDVKEAVNIFRNTAKAIKELGGVIKETKKTTAEFNKNVTVAKSSKKPLVGEDQITKPKFKKGAFTNFAWEPVAQFEGQIFPAMIISMATYKGDVNEPFMNSIKSSALGFSFNSNSQYIPLKWEIESSDKTFFDKVGGDFMIERANQVTDFMPAIPWNFSTLANQTSSTPINVIYRLFDADGNKVEKSVPLFMRSINDCIFQYQDKKFDFLFSAFIQEQHPEIDKILREALDTKFITSIASYQGKKDVDYKTLMTVAAVWKVLHDRGFQYSNVATTSTETNKIYSQSVRTLDNSLKTNQANCVDGTIVFASVLRATGISTTLVLTSDHCFLGFKASPNASNLIYLETTMLANSTFIDKAKTKVDKDNAYLKQFVAAIDKAKEEYKDYQSKNDITEIDVDYYRKFVRPLPFK
jgi:hypothetical protein